MMQQGSGQSNASPPPLIGGLGLGQKMMEMDKEKLPSTKVPGGSKRKLPSPKEMVEHYEAKGMSPQEASFKVIDDLQNLLVRVVSNNKTANKISSDTMVNTHMLRLESKIDSKPGYPQTLAIGVVSGGVWSAVANIWSYVRSSTSSS